MGKDTFITSTNPQRQCDVSICMAVFNGSDFIREQLDSIIPQMGPGDELIIVDDCSTDDSTQIIQKYEDPRIQFYCNEVNRGPIYTFQRAMRRAQKEVILLADQDDVWLDSRVDRFCEVLFSTGALVASSNKSYMDAQGCHLEITNRPRLAACDSSKTLLNIWRIFSGKAEYFGCAMALRRKALALVLPIPGFVESHDLWIAMASNLARSNAHLECDTLIRRLHDHNLSTPKRKLSRKSWSRAIFLLSSIVIIKRICIMRHLFWTAKGTSSQ